MTINTTKELYEALEAYNQNEAGVGLGRIREAVEAGELPEAVRKKFLIQLSTGQVYPAAFEPCDQCGLPKYDHGIMKMGLDIPFKIRVEQEGWARGSDSGEKM